MKKNQTNETKFKIIKQIIQVLVTATGFNNIQHFHKLKQFSMHQYAWPLSLRLFVREPYKYPRFLF